MHAFTRLASFLFFMLSLSFLTCALPTPAVGSSGLTVRSYGQGNQILDLATKLEVDIQAHVNAAVNLDTIVKVDAEINAIIKDIRVFADACLALGANIEVDAVIKTNIAVKIAAVISLIVKLCLSLSVKFGVSVLLAIFVKIDLCLRLLLINLGICIDGIVAVVVGLCVDVSVDVLAKINLSLCVGIFAQIGL